MTTTTTALRRPFENLHRAHRGPHSQPDPSEAKVGLPFHGSCPKCHHFHINHQFIFPLDSTVHTRLLCERCNHPMFGLGRASTQNTLASVESGPISTPRACFDRLGQQPALQAEALPGASGLELLTTISERRTPAHSRSTSNIPTTTPTLAAASVAGEEPGANVRQEDLEKDLVPPKGDAEGSPEERVLHGRTVTLRHLRRIAFLFKRRFSARPRLPRIRPSTHGHGARATVHASASASTTEVSSNQERPDNTNEVVNATADDTEDRHASLRARRREMTLARERDIALASKCECSPDCPCITGSAAVQVDRAETPDIYVPGYIFPPHHPSTASGNSLPSQDSRQRLDLAHIGGHFDPTRRSSSADESSSAAESGSGLIRLSQGPISGSNGSSISSRARRPLFGRASSMPIGHLAQYPVGVRSHPHVNSPIPESGSPEEPRPIGASNWLVDGNMAGRRNPIESSGNDEQSSHQSTTGLGNFRNSHEEEPLTNGVNGVSHTPTRDGDEITSTPFSGVRSSGDLDGVGPNRLSSASQDPDSEVIDHNQD